MVYGIGRISKRGCQGTGQDNGNISLGSRNRNWEIWLLLLRGYILALLFPSSCYDCMISSSLKKGGFFQDGLGVFIVCVSVFLLFLDFGVRRTGNGAVEMGVRAWLGKHKMGREE